MKKENNKTVAAPEVQESMQPDMFRPVVDFTNVEEVRKAVIMSEILNKKY
ncbi:MAG: hypothetical protein ACI30J_09160 [Paludibacteraceae bacterium]